MAAILRIRLAGALAVSCLSIAGNSALAQSGAAVRVRTANPQDSALQVHPMQSRGVMVLELAHTLDLIRAATEDAMRALNSDSATRSGRDGYRRYAAPTIQSLLRQGSELVYTIHGMCSDRSSGRAYMGVDLAIPPAAGRAQLKAYPTVVRVDRDSPAENAGMSSGDVIKAVNGSDLREATFERFLAEPGAKLVMRIERAGQPRDITVQLAPARANVFSACESVMGSPGVLTFVRLDSAASLAFKLSRVPLMYDSVGAGMMRTFIIRTEPGSGGGTTFRFNAGISSGSRSSAPFVTLWGATFWNSSEGYLQARGAPLGGVPVLEVSANTIAAFGGLRAGDVVTRVGKFKVANLAQLRSALDSLGARGGKLEMEILRDRKAEKVTLTLR